MSLKMQEGRPAKQWATGLFGCFEDMETCCMGAFCPCILYGRVVDATEGGGETNPALMYFLISALVGEIVMMIGFAPNSRRKLRSKYGLEAERNCADLFTHAFCHSCALCQESREIAHQKSYDLMDGVPVDESHLLSPPPVETMYAKV